MSSMLTPFEGGNSKSHEQVQTSPLPSGQASRSTSMLEPIPTYEEAASADIPNTQTTPTPSVPTTTADDQPPAYAVLDSNQTTFMIYGTFIHTPAGPPVYQLSTPLDQRGPFFRIRRLRAKEAQQQFNPSSTPLAFDRSSTLYEVNDPPLLDHEYHLIGKRRTCLPGVVEMKFRLNKWRVKHVPRPGAKPKELLSLKKVSTGVDRKRDTVEACQWKDKDGNVVATETLRLVEGGGAVVPTVVLKEDLDQTWRELVISLWAARLWVAFGVEKTHALGGRYGDVRFARYGGAGMVAGGTAMLGAGIVGVGGFGAAGG